MKFPIYRRILAGSEVMSGKKKFHLDPRRMEEVRKCILVESIDPQDYLSDEHRLGGNMDKILTALGPQILPFQQMWFEVTEEISTPQFNVPDVIGTAVASSTMIDQTNDQPCVTHTGFVLYKNGSILMSPIDAMIDIDIKTGAALELKMAVGEEGYEEMLDDKVLISATWHLCYPALYSIGLMNCRNVVTNVSTDKSRSSNRAQRKREPKLEYRTIVLPQKGHLGVNVPGRGGVSAAGIHKVRGHFKHYSEEAPLFGKHVGTYWWPWQVRGNKDLGEVVSTYEVKEK